MARVARPAPEPARRDERRLREQDRRAARLAQAISGVHGPVTELHQTAAQSIPNATYTPLRWDTALIDTYAAWNPETPTRLLIVRDGVHLVSGLVLVVGGTTGRRAAAIRRNGNQSVRASQTLIPAGGASDVAVPVRTVAVACQAGDYLELLTFQDSGAAQNTYVTGDDSPAGSGFTVAWHSPLPTVTATPS